MMLESGASGTMHRLITILGTTGVIIVLAIIAGLVWLAIPDSVSPLTEFKVLLGVIGFLLWLIVTKLDEIIRLLRRP